MQTPPNRRHLRRIPVWLPSDQSVIYFVTACCMDRRPVFHNRQAVIIAVESILNAAQRASWSIPLVCLMPDHIHLMAMPLRERDQSLSTFMQRWKSSSKQRMNRTGIEGAIWQREFFDHLLRSSESLTEKWQYMEMNPVRAGVCNEPAEYPYLGSPEDILERMRSSALKDTTL